MRSHIARHLVRSIILQERQVRWRITEKPLCGLQDGSGCVRHLWILRVFDKEFRERETLRLRDELNRGYFDDMKDLKEHRGKLHFASQHLIPASSAVKFPPLDVHFREGRTTTLPLTESPADATVVCVGFRANAQDMIESWTLPFVETFKSTPNVELFEVSVVETWLLSLPLIKQLLVRSMRAPQASDSEHLVQRKVVYAFGDQYWFRKALSLPNRLTGYIFLLDRQGRVRWRGCGSATSEELSSMTSCASRLVEEK